MYWVFCFSSGSWWCIVREHHIYGHVTHGSTIYPQIFFWHYKVSLYACILFKILNTSEVVFFSSHNKTIVPSKYTCCYFILCEVLSMYHLSSRNSVIVVHFYLRRGWDRSFAVFTSHNPGPNKLGFGQIKNKDVFIPNFLYLFKFIFIVLKY